MVNGNIDRWSRWKKEKCHGLPLSFTKFSAPFVFSARWCLDLFALAIWWNLLLFICLPFSMLWWDYFFYQQSAAAALGHVWKNTVVLAMCKICYARNVQKIRLWSRCAKFVTTVTAELCGPNSRFVRLAVPATPKNLLFQFLKYRTGAHHILHTNSTHCNTLQHTATHCNTLQHTATHCNTLQHTTTHYTTHCNTLS